MFPVFMKLQTVSLHYAQESTSVSVNLATISSIQRRKVTRVLNPGQGHEQVEVTEISTVDDRTWYVREPENMILAKIENSVDNYLRLIAGDDNSG